MFCKKALEILNEMDGLMHLYYAIRNSEMDNTEKILRLAEIVTAAQKLDKDLTDHISNCVDCTGGTINGKFKFED